MVCPIWSTRWRTFSRRSSSLGFKWPTTKVWFVRVSLTWRRDMAKHGEARAMLSFFCRLLLLLLSDLIENKHDVSYVRIVNPINTCRQPIDHFRRNSLRWMSKNCSPAGREFFRTRMKFFFSSFKKTACWSWPGNDTRCRAIFELSHLEGWVWNGSSVNWCNSTVLNTISSSSWVVPMWNRNTSSNS